MDRIFHEKQEGYLCAQHCLNALLQGSYFNAVDLANLAEQLDTEERLAMAESGEDTDDYKRFIEQPSGNMDDSGYFSVQVLTSALKVWGLELIPYTSTEPMALEAHKDPSQMKAYICNYKGHWFTIRKLGNQWFNLNSMLNGPQLISDTYLAMFLAQLIEEGYSIFIVVGTLPLCEAEEYLSKNPISMTRPKPATIEPNNPAIEITKFPARGYRLGTREEDEAKIMQAARALENVMVPSTSRLIDTRPEVEIISESRRQPRERIIPIKVEGRDDNNDEEVVHTIVDDEEDNADLAKALQLSLDSYKVEEHDKNLSLRFDNNPSTSSFGATAAAAATNSASSEEDDELRKALQLSLECVTAPPTPDQEEVRWLRLANLGAYTRGGSERESSTKLNT